MKRIFIFFLLFNLPRLQSQTINYAEHIAPIIYKKCTSCHRPGEIGPFSLTNYDQVAAYASTIKFVTGIKYMPPWKADPAYQHYQNENYLTDDEIQKISDWVDDQMPRGDPSIEPELPVYPKGSQIGVPDLVLSFAKSHKIKGNNTDEYRYFVLPTGLKESKDLVCLEMRPGNTSVVHHTLFWQDTTGKAKAADDATPEYGYAPEEADVTGPQNQLFGYVPGVRPTLLTYGLAQKLYAGADIKMQMHYAPAPVDETDSSTVNLFFAKTPAQRYLQSHIMLPFPTTLGGDIFVIQPETKREFHGVLKIPFKVSIFSIAPHMHKLGTHWKVFAVKPTGDTVPLINIKAWDFNWQGNYNFKKLIVLPAGSVIHAYAGYDNTSSNPHNPHSPPKLVTWGEGTGDEMYYLPIIYLPYMTGDENMVFEDHSPAFLSKLHLQGLDNRLFSVNPNPVGDVLKTGYYLAKTGKVNLKIIDQSGSLVKTIYSDKNHFPGYHTSELDVSGLAAGVYTLILEQGTDRKYQKILVIR